MSDYLLGAVLQVDDTAAMAVQAALAGAEDALAAQEEDALHAAEEGACPYHRYCAHQNRR